MRISFFIRGMQKTREKKDNNVHSSEWTKIATCLIYLQEPIEVYYEAHSGQSFNPSSFPKTRTKTAVFHLACFLTWKLQMQPKRRVSHGLGGQPTPCFFYNRFREKQCFTLPVVKDNEIVRSTSNGVEGKSGLICLVSYIRSCWCRRVLQFLVTLDNG